MKNGAFINSSTWTISLTKNLESHNRTEMEERPCPQHQPVWTRDQWRPLAVERRPPRRWNQLRTARGGLINNYNDIAFSSVLLHISCSVTTTVEIFFYVPKYFHIIHNLCFISPHEIFVLSAWPIQKFRRSTNKSHCKYNLCNGFI